MINVALMGGMCNQMFQNAYGMALESLGYEVGYDKSLLREGTHREYSLEKFGGVKFVEPYGPVVLEKSLRFDSEHLSPPKTAVAIGYWQSEKYFERVKDIVRKRFLIHDSFEGAALGYWNEIRWSPNSIALHVRRGDYIGLELFHGLPPVSYYHAAIARIRSEYPNAKVFVFSDDTDWCLQENLAGPNVVRGTTKYEDLWLMACCKHAILANSSFSWWGAYLGDWQINRIVVAPKVWFTDPGADSSTICPERWERL